MKTDPFEIKINNNFNNLMSHRVHEILLVASPYDAFILEEDGGLTEQIMTEYIGMNFNYAPRVTRASTATDSMSHLAKDKFDLAGFSVGIVSKKKILDKKNVKTGNVILAIPSNGIHSNGFSLVTSILKKNKIPRNLKKEILKPTKIYSREILKLINNNLVHAAAHITGGGLVENLLRSIPENLTVNIDLSKIKVVKIFKWLKSKNVSDSEMMKTFNCGIGFCLIVSKKNIPKIKKKFTKEFMPYEIGFVSKDKKKVNLSNYLKW